MKGRFGDGTYRGKKDDERGVLLVKHYEDDDRSFSKLPESGNLGLQAWAGYCDLELSLTAAGQVPSSTRISQDIRDRAVMEPVIVKWMGEDGWK